MNVLCTGKRVDDAMCSYLFAVAEFRQRTSNSVIFIGAGVLGWLDRQVVENFEKVEFRTDYPWGEVVQRIARKASQRKTQVIVEVPPEAQVHQTKQYQMLSEDEAWTSIKIDGCTHGQRMVIPGPTGIHTVGYDGSTLPRTSRSGLSCLTDVVRVMNMFASKACKITLTRVAGPAKYPAGCSMS